MSKKSVIPVEMLFPEGSCLGTIFNKIETMKALATSHDLHKTIHNDVQYRLMTRRVLKLREFCYNIFWEENLHTKPGSYRFCDSFRTSIVAINVFLRIY